MAQTTTTIDVNIRDNASKVLRDIGGSLGTIGKLAGVAFGVKEITQALNTYQEFSNRVKNATSSVQEFTAVQGALTSIATKNYTSLSNTADLYARLKLTTSDYNLVGKDLVNLTNTITASFKINGVSAQNQASIIDNLGKSFLKGTIDGRDFNQLLATAPDILQRYAKATGLTINQLQKLAQEGRLSSEGLIQALKQTAAEAQNTANTQEATLGQSVINLGNRFVILIGQINDATKFTKGLSLVLDNLDTIVISVGIAMGTFFTILRAGSIITVTTTAVSGLTAAFVALRVAIFAIPVVGWLAAGISLAATGAYLLYENIDKTAKSAKDAGDEIDAWYDSYQKVDPIAKGILSNAEKYLQQIRNSYETNQRLKDIEAARLALGKDFLENEQKINAELDKKYLKEAERALPGIAKQVGGTLADKFPEVEAERLKQEQLRILRENGIISEQDYQTAIGVIQANAARANLERQKKEVNDALKMITEGNASKADIEKLSQEQKIQVLYQGGKDALNALAQFNEKAFKIAKALAIAESLQNTYRAVSNALATFPFPLNIAIAGIMAARGYAEVQKIRGTQYTGARRQGGLVGENQSYLVGEDGPEMFTPSSSGRITPNDQMGQGVTVNFNISTVNADGFDEILLNRRSTIVGIINEATNKRGRVGVTQ
jgi:tape measure domain-containing protein